MANTLASTITLQDMIDWGRSYPWTIETIGLAGFSATPSLQIANDTVQEIMAEGATPWKWASNLATPFLTNPYQQDYPTSLSFNSIGWLETATIWDINNPSLPMPSAPLRTVKALLPTSICDIPQKVCFIPNRNAQTGTRQASTLYTNPLLSAGGGPNSNPFLAVTDPNGNIQVVTAFGTTGSGTPSWPAANAAAGTNTTDGGVTWTVVDPNGVAFRLDAMATNGSVVYQIRVTYQQKMPLLTGPSSTFAPIPDEMGWLLRKGFLTYLSKNAGKADFPQQYVEFQAAIKRADGEADKETQEFGFAPAEPIDGNSPSQPGGAWWYGGGSNA